MSFQTSVRRASDIAILDISGRIVLGDGSKQLTQKITELLNAGDRKILLNLAEVTYVDSAGLGELVSSYGNVKKAGGKLKLMNIQRRIVDLLEITKLYSLFESFTQEAQAVSSFQEKAASAG